jgi:hypothetical protein
MITATPRRRRPVRIGLVQLSVRFRTGVRIELKRSGNLQTETPTKHATRHVRAMIEWGIRTGSVALAALMVCPGKSPLNGLRSRDRRLVVFDLSRSELRLVAQQFRASVYAVLLSVAAGTIRRFHASCGSAFHDLIAADDTRRRTSQIHRPRQPRRGGMGPAADFGGRPSRAPPSDRGISQRCRDPGSGGAARCGDRTPASANALARLPDHYAQHQPGLRDCSWPARPTVRRWCARRGYLRHSCACGRAWRLVHVRHVP